MNEKHKNVFSHELPPDSCVSDELCDAIIFRLRNGHDIRKVARMFKINSAFVDHIIKNEMKTRPL